MGSENMDLFVENIFFLIWNSTVKVRSLPFLSSLSLGFAVMTVLKWVMFSIVTFPENCILGMEEQWKFIWRISCFLFSLLYSQMSDIDPLSRPKVTVGIRTIFTRPSVRPTFQKQNKTILHSGPRLWGWPSGSFLVSYFSWHTVIEHFVFLQTWLYNHIQKYWRMYTCYIRWFVSKKGPLHL